ncbi:MAG: restriction endonuclease subunit S [Brevinema sp.]
MKRIKQSYNAGIGSYCELDTGVTFRDKPSIDSQGEIYLISLQDVNTPFIQGLGKLCIKDEVPTNQWLEEKDILFKPRGNFIASLVEEVPVYCVTMAPIIRIRVTSNQLIPEYLVWYLNSSYSQRHFQALAARSTLLAISKSQLETLPIIVPSLEKQKKIANIFKTHYKIIELQKNKIQVQEKLVNKILNKIIEV